MGYLTLAKFRTQLNISLGEKAQSGNENLDAWINLGYFEAVNDGWFEGIKEVAQMPTVADQRLYEWPVDLMSVVSVTDLTNERQLILTDWRNYHRLDRTQTGEPQLYARRRRAMYLWPIPDGVFTIEVFYLEEICPLELDGDVTVLPQAYDAWVLNLSRKHAWMALGNQEKAAFYTQLAANDLAKLPTDEFQSDQLKRGVTVAQSWEDLSRHQSEIK